MGIERITIRILEDDYDAFREILRADVELPIQYRDWLRRSTAEKKAAIANEGTINDVLVTPNGFLAYCKDTGLTPSYFALEIYAMELVARTDLGPLGCQRSSPTTL